MKETTLKRYVTDGGQSLIDVIHSDKASVIIATANREQLKELGAACYAAVNGMILMETGKETTDAE
jgi:hypothetical protein